MSSIEFDFVTEYGVQGRTFFVYTGFDEDANNTFSFSFTGAMTRVSVPHLCSGPAIIRVDDFLGCGTVSTNLTLPVSPQACAVTDVQLQGFEPCGEYGFAEAVLEVFTQNAPTNLLVVSANNGSTTTNASPTNPTIVRVPIIGDGSQVAFQIGFAGLTCYQTASFTVPNCPDHCSISAFTLVAATSLGTNQYEVVTELVVRTPSPDAVFLLTMPTDYFTYGFYEPTPVVDGTNVFTNTFTFSGVPRTLTASFEMPQGGESNAFYSSYLVCNQASLVLDINNLCPANDCPVISDVNVTFGPCNPYGVVTAAVEVVYENAPTNGFLSVWNFGQGRARFLAGTVNFDPKPTPVTGSPQTILVPVLNGSATENFLISIGEGAMVPKLPTPVDPATEYLRYTALFNASVETSVPDCPAPPPLCTTLEVLESVCHPIGYNEVTIGLTDTNALQFYPLPFIYSVSPINLVARDPVSGLELDPQYSSSYLGSFTESHPSYPFKFFLPREANTWEIIATLPGCTVTQQVVVGDCSVPPDLCEVLDLKPVAVSDCVPGGKAEITFELTATNALGSWFGFDADAEDLYSFSPFWVQYTNTPTVFTAQIRAKGDLVTASVTKGIALGNRISMRTNCHFEVADIAMPNCYEIPAICLISSPRILDIDTGVDSNPFRRTITYTIPGNVIYAIEQTSDLSLPWSVLSRREHYGSLPEDTYNDYSGAGMLFYRIRCEPVPVPVPVPAP